MGNNKNNKKEKKVIKDLSELKNANIKVDQIPKSKYLIEVNLDNFHQEQKSPIPSDRMAHAPYNFVRLNKEVININSETENVCFDKYITENKFTGYINLNIKAKSPVYTRCTQTEDQYKELDRIDKQIDEAKKRKNNAIEISRLDKVKIVKLWELSNFFSPANGKLRLPGSSLRGLIRNIVEIVSYGKFHFFDDKRLYFRGLADQSNLRYEYGKYGLSINRSYQMLGGILKKDGLNYFLYETGNPGQISFSDASNFIVNSGVTVFDPNKMKAYPINAKGFYIVVSGNMQGKSHHWTINYMTSSSNKLSVDSRDIKEYNDDGNKSGQVIDLLKEADSKFGTPCFYTKSEEIENGKKITRIYFGHTGMFRVPYKKTIGEHIPDELKDQETIDISEMIFGNEKTFAGRVFFEDSFCNENDVLIGANYPHILSGAKPTTFQHYLTQVSENVRELKHYNLDSENKLSLIRGYKLYWHRSGKNWIENDIPDDKISQYTKINPVKENTTFTGRIRFENLSEIELGALLFALDLPDGCCHKIGMGKPLGLGSIKITPTIHLSNREERYKDLFEEWDSDLKESTENGKTKEDFENKFATFILNQLYNDKKEYKSDTLWKEERMLELKRMLDFEHKPDDNLTSYMEIEKWQVDENGVKKKNNEFKNRPVLPKPIDVIKD